jgi:hypothetical protein
LAQFLFRRFSDELWAVCFRLSDKDWWTQSTIGAALTIPALVALNSLGEADRAPSEFARRRDWAADRGGL